MEAPSPPELASMIISGVAETVELDLEPIRVELREKLRLPFDGIEWEQAERIAGASLRDYWAGELEEQVARGLAHVHEELLVGAARCLEAADDLDREGVESWIGRAVLYRLAFDAAFDVLTEDEFGGIELFPDS